ncbi:hypothetical protein KRR38_01640 [Novosphingobium sp. G106]|uniref:hypothetical protein n=1 Tax=Novosphingobium sp. G106 TaxID=2849500 RepID=UPI001C2CDA16|nr:hypothetical protein [Novosphingobium sp. G106]MBV1686406.1 hypothetical protein [Novosphingobium sp. G106]
MSEEGDLHEPVILHDYEFVADLGLRNDADGNRQDAMVIHNEEKNLALAYTFQAKVSTATTTKQVGEVAAQPSTAAGRSLMARRAAEPPLPFVDYRYQDQFAQGVDDAVVILMTEHEIAEAFVPDFKAAVTECAESFKLATSRTMLPDQPERDYTPGEGILNYLRAPEGFGPWVAAGRGVLTRPLIREKAPKAYTALANWLRSNELPNDLPIPTKSEALDAQLASPISVREARRIARRGDRASLRPS